MFHEQNAKFRTIRSQEHGFVFVRYTFVDNYLTNFQNPAPFNFSKLIRIVNFLTKRFKIDYYRILSYRLDDAVSFNLLIYLLIDRK